MFRIFHSIGQGGFITEHLIMTKNSPQVNVTYDCGSITNKNNLYLQIDNTFNEDDEIDILFISHFDSDHINGINYLKKRCHIKNIIIPLLTNDEIKFQLLVNTLILDYTDNAIFIDPENYFGEGTNIIRVDPSDEGSFIEPESSEGIESFSKKKTIKSGTNIKIGNWYYVPFNFKYNDRKNFFEEEIKKNRINIKSTISVLKNIDLIKKIYKTIPGGVNENSLVIYSGNKKTKEEDCGFCFSKEYNNRCMLDGRRPDRLYRYGCLFLGDFNLRNNKAYKELINKYKSLLDTIGTIQIPHHGSYHSFCNEILKDIANSIEWVICFGNNNTYGHPSNQVLLEIVTSRQGNLIEVTEDNQSEYLQKIPIA